MYASIVFLPLIGSVIAGILSLGNHDKAAERITIAGLLLSLLFSIFAFAEVAIGGQPITINLSRWIVSGDFEAHWRLRFDTLTAVMLIVVTGV
ncbi:MAG: NADH-quinone oxidoreductase subunit L, partial [Candidatus Puniceispirillum sp.]|nr:NADH-quinone oxidoreductase subunit L [Candidatus Puniceispirillum sp.]